MLKDQGAENFLKQVLTAMKAGDMDGENSWVDIDDLVLGREFGKEGIGRLVEGGVMDLDDDKVRFRNKVMYNAILNKYFQ